MTITLDTPEPPGFTRNGHGQPIINGKPYTRISNLGSALADSAGLTTWQRRNTAHGLATDPSLVARMVAIGGNPTTWTQADKAAVSAVIDDADIVAGANRRRDLGTALHRILERYDLDDHGAEIGPYAAELEAYQTAMDNAGLKVLRHTELAVVNHQYRAAGTCDNLVVDRDGQVMVMDKKTGSSVTRDPFKFAAQLAGYAHGEHWDHRTHATIPWPAQPSQDIGIVCHIPAGEGTCTLYTVNLADGRATIELEQQVKGLRSAARKWLLPFGSGRSADVGSVDADPVGATPSSPPGVAPTTPTPDEHAAACEHLRDQIRLLHDRDRAELSARWNTGRWGPTNILRTPDKVTAEHLTEITALVRECDPFWAVTEHPTPEPPATPVRPEPLTPHVDNSGPAHPLDVDTIRQRVESLPDEARRWLIHTVRHRAGIDSRNMSAHQLLVVNGMYWCARLDPTDDTLTGLLRSITATPLGHNVGDMLKALDTGQARQFSDLADLAAHEQAALTILPDGSQHWEPSPTNQKAETTS